MHTQVQKKYNIKKGPNFSYRGKHTVTKKLKEYYLIKIYVAELQYQTLFKKVVFIFFSCAEKKRKANFQIFVKQKMESTLVISFAFHFFHVLDLCVDLIELS